MSVKNFFVRREKNSLLTALTAVVCVLALVGSVSANVAPAHSNGISLAMQDSLSVVSSADSAACIEDKVYNFGSVEQQPKFPGGENAMYEWIAANLEYPRAAIEEGVQGRVTVLFTIGRDGTIRNVKVVRGKHPALDKEARRVVMAMPKWIPARHKGHPVAIDYVLPITFKLKNNEIKK